MMPKATFLLPLAAAFVLIASAGTVRAQTEVLAFDDLSSNGLFEGITNGYGGLHWNNFYSINTVQAYASRGDNGYVYGVVSPNNVAFNGFGSPALFSAASAFNLNFAYLTSAWNDGMQIEVQGFVNGALTYDNTYTVNSASPALINFNYVGVDEVKFISTGGTTHGYGGAGEEFAMDNLSVTLDPRS